MSETTPRQTEHVSRESANLVAERIGQLKALFPDAVSEGKIDFDRLRAALGDSVTSGPERFNFSWAGRSDAVALLQMPSRATLVPCPEESVEFDTTKNLFIEGDNLEVLKLLYKAYAGKVKLIYIDPPYNTGQDFIYPDNFADPLAVYLQMTGQQDSSGNLLTSNPETSGRYHSAWLSMMLPRLFLARQLLRDDGVIFVSIDDHEIHHLRMLLNEVFGEEHFLCCLVWKRRQVSDNRNVNNISTDHEYVLAFGKRQTVFKGEAKDLTKYSNPDNDPRGPWMSDNLTGLASKAERPNLHYDLENPETGITYPPLASRGWAYEPATMSKLVQAGQILWPKQQDGRPRLKRFLQDIRSQFTGFSSLQDVGFTTDGTREVESIFGAKVFAFPKPVKLVRMLCEQATDAEDIVLDFFAGAGTTAQAVMELNRNFGSNRRFILVQLPEPTNNKDFPTIAEIAKERIRRNIALLKKDIGDFTRNEPEDLGFRVFKLGESNFVSWSGTPDRDPEKYHEQMSLFVDPLRLGWTPENVLWEVAIKEGYGLNSIIEPVDCEVNTVYRVVDPDKDPPQSFRGCLDETLNPDIAKALALTADDLFVCRDRALDDTLAANLALQCRLKTI